MQNVVQDVEHEREKEGRPANCQHGEDCVGRQLETSRSERQSEAISGHHHSPHRQAGGKWYSSVSSLSYSHHLESGHKAVVADLFNKLRIVRAFNSSLVHHVLKINLIEA